MRNTVHESFHTSSVFQLNISNRVLHNIYVYVRCVGHVARMEEGGSAFKI